MINNVKYSILRSELVETAFCPLSMASFYESTAMMRATVMDEYLAYANWWWPIRPVSIAKPWRSVLANDCSTLEIHGRTDIDLIKHVHLKCTIFLLPSINQLINQSINQSFNQSINQSVKKTVGQSVSQSVSEWVSEWVSSVSHGESVG